MMFQLIGHTITRLSAIKQNQAITLLLRKKPSTWLHNPGLLCSACAPGTATWAGLACAALALCGWLASPCASFAFTSCGLSAWTGAARGSGWWIFSSCAFTSVMVAGRRCSFISSMCAINLARDTGSVGSISCKFGNGNGLLYALSPEGTLPICF